jgi:hypothetical protein
VKVPEGEDADPLSWVFKSKDGTRSFSQVQLPSLPFHLEVKVGASVGFCCKEFEDILFFHLQDVKDPDTVLNFPSSYDTNQQHPSLGSTKASSNFSMTFINIIPSLHRKSARVKYCHSKHGRGILSPCFR